MANKTRTAKLTAKGGELTVQQHETDSPLIPVALLERLHRFKPEGVDWVMQQTEIEAENRRVENRRVNKFVFINRVLGQVFAFFIGLAGICGGAFVAVNGSPWAGGIIASLAMTGLAGVFLTGKRTNEQAE